MTTKGKEATSTKGKKKHEADRLRRLEVAALNEKLAKKQCRSCTTIGVWTIYARDKQKGRVRYIKCGCCGYNDQVPVIVNDPTETKGI